MSQADAIHVRCPGNLGFLGVILARFFSRYRVAKYAGQWNGYAGENLTGRLQRWLLKSWWWGAPVTVYGDWKNQPPHIHSFFTSMMSDEQVESAVIHARDKMFSCPLRALFSGRLVAEKRVHVFIEAIASVAASGVELEVRIVGDGPLRSELEALARARGIDRFTRFVGAVPFEQSLEHYHWADCLVLPSVHSEGWPKVIAEAMCHGLICVAVDHGQVARMLAGRGILLPNGDPQQFVTALKSIAEDLTKYRELGQQASLWSQRYSRDGLRLALANLLQHTWGVQLVTNAPSSPSPKLDSAEVLLNE
ncbi:glycosyl transferase group 1 [Rhodopirellula maiorica SM1]|uniref:Glycosyl transferase group 1 n=1 Tax=Rhodopirellula maiorica SM1 TaxID=1265738 RepID=M5RQI6_9BACT|nr:glycosyltransferase [Rhodopirellula maiorica]EMI17647.1 glycosyl transferase group 1 [Rhodopirellula maiorica SM1]